ncbi:MAG: tetratricopeptide repeat protein [Candidatus Pacebacteria bacterium]|jgi:cytochrome c-type biogenesis protein CcmH/NrfG|nr:tetratricopeptide repeat protein [Candidatus Paceibacterota bacterium]MDP7648453.1 tetratricopeptide repeat protein [Candidatus Paceibacterota bacterium]
MEYAKLNVEDRDKTPFLENLALYFIIGVMFLLPIFFIPSLSIPFSFTKSILIFVSILVAFFLFLISRLKRGQVALPTNAIALVAWGLPLAYLISAIFSGNSAVSYLGQGFEIDTFGFIAIMVLMLSLVPLLLKTRELIFRIHIALLLSLVLLAIFQGLRLIFGADFLSFGIFTSSTANLLGKWNDLGIFLGLTSVLSLITLEGLPLNKLSKIILYVILAISLVFLSAVNFLPVWIIVGLFALGLFVYGLSKGKFKTPVKNNKTFKDKPETSKAFIPSLIILIVSIVFIAGGSTVSGYTSSFFKTSQIEARPSWQSTIDITKKTYNENFLFGSGPNTFMNQWALHKPQSINNTLFWNIDFSSGIGLVPTSFTTTGLWGGIAWIAFFVFFLYSGFRNLVVSAVEDRASYYLSLSMFLGSLYLWIFTVIYIPNVVIVTLAFLLTGMYIASLRYRSGAQIDKEINFAAYPRIGFISIMMLTVLIIISGVSLYMIGGQYASAILFQKSLVAANVNGDINAAEDSINSAINLGNNDAYYRFAAEIDLAKINQVLADQDRNIDERRAEFQSILASAISNVQGAIAINNNNYQNWSMLGRVYGSVVPLGVDGAYESARRSYEQAISLNPNNPALYLALARLELARDSNNIEEAKQFIGAALEKKNNYTEAIFLLSQLQIQEGNIESAITSVEAAVIIEPNNSVFFFQLGLLQSNVGDSQKAIAALERAIALNPQYSNARYFLGLNYFQTGEKEKAVEHFTYVSDLNPDNEEVKAILESIIAGDDPFAGGGKTGTLPIGGE